MRRPHRLFHDIQLEVVERKAYLSISEERASPVAVLRRVPQVCHYLMESVSFDVVEEAPDVKQQYADLKFLVHCRLNIVDQRQPGIKSGGEAAGAELGGVDQSVFVDSVEEPLGDRLLKELGDAFQQ